MVEEKLKGNSKKRYNLKLIYKTMQLLRGTAAKMHAKNFGSETELIFKDKGMLLCMILWAVLVVLILYGIPDVVMSVVGGG